ncbi:MAG: NosD domain-containing protein [Candidatus Micrarchaeia archaeon]
MEEAPSQENSDTGEQGVMRVDVTPQSPLIAQQPKEAPAAGGKKSGLGSRRLLLTAIAIIIVIAAAVVVTKIPYVTSTTTAPTTTIESINVSLITKCTTIKAPGSYYLKNDINTSISSGACIAVDANNVNIVCNGNKLTGSGPYTNVPPYTYGIEAAGRDNITISGCYIKDFSYGVYLKDVSFASIVNSNISKNYMNNVYIGNTTHSRILDSYLSYSAGTTGSIYVSNNSYENSIDNNTMLYNRYYGVYIGSGGNSYTHNYINGTPYSFYCRGAYGLANSSTGEGNTCYNNNGCGFLSCKGVNIPTNLSQIYLPNEIRSCGSIVKSGTYYLESGLSMNKYVNTSNPLLVQYDMPCINIAVGNVTLDCNSKAISNATYAAITADNVGNVTIENCGIKSSSFGVLLSNASGVHVSNISVYASTVGLALKNTSLDVVSGLNAFGNAYGIYIKGSNGDLFSNFNASHNNVGIYIVGSIGNSFNDGVARNNTKLDVYAATDSQNATYNLMQATTCTYTNAAWATCAEHISPSLAYTPLISCAAITKAGNYSMLNDIYNAPSGCITIRAKNVELNCNGGVITSAHYGYGTGVQIAGSSNVTLRNCNINAFNMSVYARSSSALQLADVNADSAGYGLVLSNVSDSSITVSNVGNPRVAGVYLNGSSYNRLSGINVTGGNVALLINNSGSNLIEGNAASGSTIGMLITGHSENNTINNNIMEHSASVDYKCVGNSGVASELGGINYGSTKQGCAWLAALSQSNPDVACAGISSPASISLSSDGTYPYSYSCFGVSANSTTIDCNGHTVIATNGGTFAMFDNSQHSVIEDCVLKGFTDPIIAVNSSVSIVNDTIVANGAKSTGISVTGSSGPNIIGNNVSAYTGISISNSANGELANNVAGSGAVAYAMRNSTGFKISGNLALQNAAIAFMLNNSVFNMFQNNNFESMGGIACRNNAMGSANNTDLGGNLCAANQGCKWVTSPRCV